MTHDTPVTIHTTDLTPFRGWRYRADLPLHRLLTPPYDVIGPLESKTYRERHAYNIVRVILPQKESESPPGDWYAEAARTLYLWRTRGIIVQDPAPSYYLMRQKFTLPGGNSLERWGIIGRFKLRPWGEGILPHEQIFPGTKADRMALLRAIRTQFSPIFSLAPFSVGDLLDAVRNEITSPPAAHYVDDDGVEHMLWVMSKPTTVARVREIVQGKPFYVADGHHRYETALSYQREMRQRYPNAPEGSPFDYTLMYVASMDDPNVVILPTHRALDSRLKVVPERIIRIAQAAYDVTLERDDDAVIQWAERAPAGLPDIVLLFPQGPAYRLHLRMDRPVVQRLFAETPRPLADLAVYQLQRLILGPGVGVGDAPEEQKRIITFHPDARRLVTEVRAGRWHMVALVAPTSLAQLRALADARLIAPPKATYFYPKLPSGLVMYCLEE